MWANVVALTHWPFSHTSRWRSRPHGRCACKYGSGVGSWTGGATRYGRSASRVTTHGEIVVAKLLARLGPSGWYALLTNEDGGIRDDLMIARLGEVFFVVANAACKDADESYLRQTLSHACTIERRDDRALLALQGPAAEAALARLVPDVRSMRFMDVRAMEVMNVACTVSRSGYTGEDGFEISLPASHAETVARALLANGDVAMIGLGARDSLRLEAGLCLYGSDLDATTTPVEAGLEWSIQKVRRSGGSRAGNFPGAERILHQLANGAPRRRVGLRPEGRAPIRHGAQLFADKGAADAIGAVTSGGFGPSVNAPIAMGYVTPPGALAGGTIYADLRGTRVPLRLSELPFISTTYKR